MFVKDFLAKGRPLLVTDAAADWGALDWDFEAFRDVVRAHGGCHGGGWYDR